MLHNTSMNQHGMKNSHQQLDSLSNKMLHNTSISQHGTKNSHQPLDSLRKKMPHHISMNQHGMKNSHQLLDSVKIELKDHHSLMNQHSTIECQLVQVSCKSMDQKDLENQHLMKECQHLQDLSSYQFAKLQELKVLHVFHQINNYSQLEWTEMKILDKISQWKERNSTILKVYNNGFQ